MQPLLYTSVMFKICWGKTKTKLWHIVQCRRIIYIFQGPIEQCFFQPLFPRDSEVREMRMSIFSTRIKMYLKPVEVYMFFRPPPLFTFVSLSTVPIPMVAPSQAVGLRPVVCWDLEFHRKLMSVCSECFFVPGRGLFVGLIPRPKESYRASCVWLCSRSCDNEDVLFY